MAAAVRQLAAELGTYTTYVQRALAHLASQGLIGHVQGTGFYTGDEQPRHHPPRPKRNPGQGSRAAGQNPHRPENLIENSFVTVDELARFLRVSNMTIYRAISDGRLKDVVRLTPLTIRIPSGSVRNYLKDCGINGPEFSPDGLDDGEGRAGAARP